MKDMQVGRLHTVSLADSVRW